MKFSHPISAYLAGAVLCLTLARPPQAQIPARNEGNQNQSIISRTISFTNHK